MCLLVWKGSLEKPLLRDVLAGSAATAAWPERAPVMAGVAFLEDAASVGGTGAAVLMLVSKVLTAMLAAAAGVAFARALPCRGAARPFCFVAAPGALRDF
jgi:hypothetical protein